MLEMLNDASYQALLQESEVEPQLMENITAFLTIHQGLFEDLQTPLFFIGIAFVLKSVKRIRTTAPTPSLKKALLTAEGGTNFWNVIGCCGLYFGVIFILYLVLMMLAM